jgi:hypothetical protein
MTWSHQEAGGMAAIRKLSSGSDEVGEVFAVGEAIYRGIFPGHADQVQAVLERCARHDLFSRGLIGTRVANDPFPHLGYELVLQHDPVRSISYPHEWSPVMFHDAALFLVDLEMALASCGLILKDPHLYNVAFDRGRPLYLDFASVIPMDQLPSQEYLKLPRAQTLLKVIAVRLIPHELFAA